MVKLSLSHIVTHTVARVQVPPMLEKKVLRCNAGHQEVGRCHTRGVSEDCTGNKRHPSKGPTWFRNPGKMSKEVQSMVYQWAHKKGLESSKILENETNNLKPNVALLTFLEFT